MAINRWREVTYTDDGCSVYQCLMCKGRYEGRTAPGWFEHDTGVYHPIFVYCPFCGTCWDGGTQGSYENERGFGPRRLRSWKALLEGWHRRRDEKLPSRCWVVEKLRIYKEPWNRDIPKWEIVNCFDPLKVSAVDMKKNLASYRQDEIDWPDDYCEVQFRVRLIPTPKNARL